MTKRKPTLYELDAAAHARHRKAYNCYDANVREYGQAVADYNAGWIKGWIKGTAKIAARRAKRKSK